MAAVASRDLAYDNRGMLQSAAITVRIDLARIRANVLRIRQQVGVAILGVIKADAYGLGITRVAPAIADVVDGWCVLTLDEAASADLWRLTGKPIITLGPPSSVNPQDYLEQHVRPAVSDARQAKALAAADPLLCVDTGMQRFTCPADLVEPAIEAGSIREAFTHATRLEQAELLRQAASGHELRLHAAGSSLLDEPRAYLSAVRPGLAMYQGAARVSTHLVEVHDSNGPVGYSGFHAQRHGVILGGYAHGLAKGPCLVNGQLRQIAEVGMQSAYVCLEPEDSNGDEVVLLGDGLDCAQIGSAWGVTPHQVMVRLSGAGQRQYSS